MTKIIDIILKKAFVLDKAASSLLPIEIIAKLEWKQSNAQQNIVQQWA